MFYSAPICIRCKDTKPVHHFAAHCPHTAKPPHHYTKFTKSAGSFPPSG